MCSAEHNGIRPALVNRHYLHSNATSHEWMFGAIAELIDNASDPDVMATQFFIDKVEINGEICLEFIDNGNGMNTETLHRMLSFGFSDKVELNGRSPIGRYGNGFKSGSMRLAKDAMVFTKHQGTQSIGLLSQTFLERINADTVLVPMVTWNSQTMEVIYPKANQKSSLAAILKYSIFKTESDIMKEFEGIPHRWGNCQGTKIILYNLTKDEFGNLELDFKTDEDVLLSSHNQNMDTTTSNKVSLFKTSLRKYLAILYMKPPMQIFLRNNKVKTIYMNKFLMLQQMFTYTPKIFTIPKPIKIRYGINPDQDEYGIMMYNRNRLIQAFRKPTMPKQGSMETEEYQKVREIWEQTIGIVELDCLTPNHIKQNFQDDRKFRNIETNLTNKLWCYCWELLENEKLKSVNVGKSMEKDLWVQCEESECQKWRRLPFGTRKELLPDVWKCYMNPDPEYNNCSVPEEPEKDPEIQKAIRPKKVGRRNSEQTLPISSAVSEATSAIAIESPVPIVPDQFFREHHSPPQVPELEPELENIIFTLQSESAPGNNRKRPFTSHVRAKKKINVSSSEVKIIPSKKQPPEVIVIEDDEDNTDADDISDEWNSHSDVKHNISFVKVEHTSNINQVQVTNKEMICPITTFSAPTPAIKSEPIFNGNREDNNSSTFLNAIDSTIGCQVEELQRRIFLLEEEKEQLQDELNHEKARAELLEKKLSQLESVLDKRK